MNNNNIGQYWGTQKQQETEDSYQLFIDNRYRSNGTNVDFIVDFDSTNTNISSFGALKNVKSVELKGIHGDFSTNEYIILDIQELNTRMISNVPAVNNTFGIIYIDDKVYIKGSDFDKKIKIFPQPISKLSRLSIKLKKADGSIDTNLYIDDPGTVTLLFEIKYIKNIIY